MTRTLVILFLFFLVFHPESHGQSDAADSVHRLARQTSREYRFADAVKLYRESILLRGESNRVEELASSYSHLGVAYMNLGLYDSSLYFLEKGLQLRQEIHSPDNIKMANSYRPLTNFYRRIDDPAKGLPYQLETVRLASGHFGPNHLNTSDAYNKLGLLYGDMQEYAKAHDAFHNAYQIAVLHDNIRLRVTLILNFGWIYEKLDQPDSSLYEYNRALKLLKANKKEPDYNEALLYNNIGIIYAEKIVNLDSSRYYLNKSLVVYRALFPDNHPGTLMTLYNLGVQARLDEDYDNAIRLFDEAITANSVSSDQDNPDRSAEDYYILDYVIAAHRETAMCYKAMGTEEAYRKGLEHIEQCARLLELNRKRPREYSDRLRLGETINWVYEIGVELCFLLFENDPSMMERAFEYSELGRASLLKLFLSDLSARRTGYVPDSLLLQEEQLTIEKSRLGDALKSAPDSGEIAQLQKELLLTNQQYESIIRRMESEIPAYYKMKYEQNVSSLDVVLSSLKEEGSVTLEYFLAEFDLYTFVLTDQRAFFIKTPVGDNYPDRITEFFNAIQGNSTISGDSLEEYLLTQAFNLYDTLIRPAENYFPEGTSRLTVVPHSQLALVPFDMLLTESGQSNIRSRNLPFLIRKYAIGQAFSASMMAESKENSWNATANFIGFAPEYDNELLASAEELAGMGNYRRTLSNLKHTKSEVEQAAELFGGDVLTGNLATESAFKKNGKNYQILHLAMHAFVDSERPLNSKLLFAREEEGGDDGYLNFYELYNTRLDAQLAVLSACSTGYGQWGAGEGILSIGRAFAYAGCPSVVMSLWPAQDQATSELMNYFYQNLSNGMAKDEALRQAKLDYLDNSNDLFTHPFYWSGFILQGDKAPVVNSGKNLFIVIAAMAILAICLLYFLVRKRRYFN